MKWIWSIFILITACSAENPTNSMIEPEIPIEPGTYRYLSLGELLYHWGKCARKRPLECDFNRFAPKK